MIKRNDWMVYRGHVINRRSDKWVVLRSDEELFVADTEKAAMEWIDKKREADYKRTSKR